MKRHNLFGKRSRFPGSSKRRQNGSLARGGRRLQLEPLEQRQLLAADIVVGLGGNEPHIAVNPLDPANIVVSQGGQIRISTDFGANFQGPFTAQLPPGLPAGYGVDGDDVVAFDGQGRLFWTYLIVRDVDGDGNIELGDGDDISVAVQRINDARTFSGAFATNAVDVTPGFHSDDKQWLAVDSNPASPFAGNVYLHWTRFDNSPTEEMFSRSIDGGGTFSAAAIIATGGGEGFRHQSNIAVAANGDVYASYHAFTCGSNEADGDVIVLRDSNGGADLAAGGNPPAGVQKTSVFASSGVHIEVTCNRQPSASTVPNARFLMQGAAAPFLLADPVRPGNIYVMANDDPNDNAGSGDDGDVVLARSTDNGNTWSVTRIDDAPQGPNSLQVFPQAAIDEYGNVAVFWYDTRRQINNNAGTPGDASDDYWNLDVYATVSNDGGLSFSPNFRINNQPFDPQLGAPNFQGDSPPTFRIGEYNGIAAFQGTVYVDWTGNTAGGQQILFDEFSMLGPFADSSEPNNFISTATILGSLPKITLQDRTLDVAQDVDFYKYTAQDTGKLVANLFFNPAVDDLSLLVRDANGNSIEAGTQSSIVDGLSVEEFVIPVVSQEEYFIEVLDSTDATINPIVYDLEIENFAAPIPDVVLDPASDTGFRDNDNLTRDNTPRFLIQADLSDFGIPLDTNGAEGADVEVHITGVDTGTSVNGNATRVGATNIWTFTPAAALPDDVYLVSAAVNVTDGQTPSVTGRWLLGHPLRVIIDTEAPTVTTPDMAPYSDSGASSTDNVTNVTAPAFFGFVTGVEPGGSVQVLLRADNFTAGKTDILAENDSFEITSEPLKDGVHNMDFLVKDLAGNFSTSEASLEIVIDSIDGSGQPERPTIDLLDADDTGMSATDNNTRLSTLRFRVTADPGTTVDVKDGNTVIDTFVMPVAGEAVRTYNFVTLVGTTGFPAEGPHPLSAESTDLAGNRGPQAEELLVTIDQTAPTVDVPDMLASSDSGLFSNDEVTNINAPAFDGFVRLQAPEAGVKVFLFASGKQIGQTDLLVDFQDNTFQYEITSEPLDDGAYGVAATVQDLAGNFSGSLSLPIWIDTVAPNTPYLDLVDASDSGRSNQDNVTNVNQPTVTVTADDTVSGDGNPFWHEIQYRIYDRPDLVGNNGEVLLVDSLVTNPGLSTNGFFTETLSTLADGVTAYTLPDAVHNLKLEVEDRAGNISHDFLLPVTIDTVAPPVTITGIDPATSDTGVEGQPATFADNITSDTATGFVGTAEADAIVRMWADGAPVSAGVINGSDVFQGLTVAVPLDGNLAFPNGQWNLAGQFDLNDPTVGFPLDGHREISTTAEDLAGNVSDPEFFDVFIDTRGPQVDGVAIASDPAYDLFNPKGPDTPDEGPTPLVFALDIAFVDQPTRLDGALNFVYPAVNQILATEPGNYLLVGDANGVIPIERIAFNDTTVDGGIGTTTVTLNFFKPLPDDRFTLTIFDRIKDDAGNALDGESNAIEPQDNPQFPSGDGDPGESFVGRFTVDSRPEIGVWSAGSVYTDTNGNFHFDPTNLDFTNRDITYLMGFASDDIFAGNFALLPGDTADGFDKLAAYGHNTASRYRWLVDTDNDGVANVNSVEPAAFDGLGTPVAGNFDGVAGNGDEVGLFTGSSWLLDTDHDFLVSDEVAIDPGLRGYPIVGDFDGDGADDLGVFLSGVFSFDLAAVGGLGNGIDATFAFNFLDFIGPRERPVAADMNQDGIDDLGLWVPDRSGAIPEAGGEWYFLISDATLQAAGSVAPLNHTFSPVPFGDDLFAQFGDQYAAPIVGNFDPPVAGSVAPAPDTLSLEGTDGDDTLKVTVDGPGQWTVELNGIQLEVGPEIVAVEFDGLGGKDSVTLTGSAGADTVKLWPGHGELSGEGYTVAIAGAESIVVRGGGGADVAVLYANPDGKDSFRAYPEVAKLFGDGYFNQVGSFRYVSAVSTDGNEDTAALYDNPNGDDVLKAGPDQARLYSDSFSNKAVNFRYVTATGTEGNKDTAVLFDDPAGDDVLKAWPEEAKLYGDGFHNRVRSFRYVKAIGTQGNKDVAVLFDDPNGDDVLKAWPEEAKLYSDSFHNMAVDFLYVNAYSTPGNKDLATFIDSAGKDTFEAWPETAKLSGEGFFNQAVSFSSVHAYSVAGGNDVAYLHGSAGNDRLVAKSRFTRLSGDGFLNRAVSFDQVYAYGSDGADLAVLYDAVLEAGLTQQPVPAGISSIVWLYDIETIRERSQAGGGAATDAVDTILTAYWQ